MQFSSPGKFHVFDAIVASDIDLPELVACKFPENSAPDFFLLMASARDAKVEHDWFHHWYQDEAKQIIDSSLAREGAGYRIRFRGQADFLILESGSRIICEPFLDVPLETLRHLFLDHVLPRIMGQRGELVLHASAVELPDGSGIAFVGKSGWGKSTLASSFRDIGARFLGDDCLHLKVVDAELIGIPAYGGTRLWEDSSDALFPEGVSSLPVSHYNSKRRISWPDRGKQEPTIFKALFFLDDPESAADEAPGIQPMRGTAAIVELIKRSFLLDVKSVDSAAGQFAAIGKLLATRPMFYTLQYPRAYSRLADVRQAILDTVGCLHRIKTEKQAST